MCLLGVLRKICSLGSCGFVANESEDTWPGTTESSDRVWFMYQKMKMEEAHCSTKNRSLAPAVSTRSRTVNRAAHSRPHAHNLLVALTHWAVHLLKLVYCFTNFVFCERGFAQQWWSAHTKIWKYCSHCLTAQSRLDSIVFIY